MVILYGGAFNPPTIAHLGIIKYLIAHYPDASILVMPSNDRYKDEKQISFIHRFKMVEIMTNGLSDNLKVSDFELTQNKEYLGTADTLAKLNHPYFVMGADAFKKIENWINHETLIKDNHFIVFPRDNINCFELIKNSKLLTKYADHFEIISDFEEIDCSSTSYRVDKKNNLLTKEVYDYIINHNLYL